MGLSMIRRNNPLTSAEVVPIRSIMAVLSKRELIPVAVATMTMVMPKIRRIAWMPSERLMILPERHEDCVMEYSLVLG